MMRFIASLVVFLWWFPELAVTESGWVIPGGNQNDFTMTFHNGQSVPLSWVGWDISFLDNRLNGEKHNDLWVTAFDDTVVPFSKLIAKDIGISAPGQYTWKIDIPGSALSKTAKYVLRFKNPANPRDSYDPSTRQLPSKGFIIIGASSNTTTDTAPSDIPAESPVTEHLSFSAKVGIGCGAGIGGLILIFLGAWVLSAKREVNSLRLKVDSLEAGEIKGEEHASENHSSDPRQNLSETLNTRPMQIGELPNHMISRPTELPGAHSRYR